MPAFGGRFSAGTRALGAVVLLGGLFVPRLALAGVACPTLPASNENEEVDSALTGLYQAYPLPPIPGALNSLTGGLQVDRDDPNLFYVIDESESETTTLRSIRVVRDACQHVVNWEGTSTLLATIPYGDANLLQGPADTFIFTEWPENHISQLAAAATATTWRTDMDPLGVNATPPHDGFSSGTSGLAYVPAGYTTTGQLRTMTYGGDFYSVPFSADPTSGQYTLSATTFLVNVASGVGGMAYIAAGAPGLTSRALVVLEYNNDTLAAFVTDTAGTPNGARTQILSVANGAWGGGFSDPISGDLYWTAWSADDLVHVVSGFARPECAGDSNCHSSQWCSAVTGHCIAKLASGTAVPSDAGHVGAPLNGACTAPAALATCLSGQCNATTNTCAAGDGSACASASDCASNLCGTEAVCGASSTPACTPLNQATTCPSSSCGEDGNCLPPVTAQCSVDADCAGQYCQLSTVTCVARLTAGSALPTDGLHDTCTAGSNAACISGLCNVTTATCAGANGSACTGASQCTSNACGATLLCEAPLSCAADEDCTAAQYCDADANACANLLASGQPFPRTGRYAACGAGATNHACASGRCDASRGLCGAPIGTACSAATDCASSLCDTTTDRCVACLQDSQCSGAMHCSALNSCAALLADGTACARASECASAQCEASVCTRDATVPVVFAFPSAENTHHSSCSVVAPAATRGARALALLFGLAGVATLRRRRRSASSPAAAGDR